MSNEDVINGTASGLYAVLTAATGLTALLASSTSAYEGAVPQVTSGQGDADSLPAVVYANQSGIRHYTFDGQRYADMRWLVKGVSHSRWPNEAGQIDGQIDAALHDAALSITGWTLLYCRREADVSYPEGEYFHRGGIYHIHLEKS